MIEVFYVLLLVVFGALIVATGTTYGLSASALREELANLRERLDRDRSRVADMRQQLGSVELDIQLLEMEKESYEAQEACMRNLDLFDAGGEITKTTEE